MCLPQPLPLEDILAGQDRAVFICGIARNLDDLLDLFDGVFLLHIDEPTQEARLDAYTRDQARCEWPPGIWDQQPGSDEVLLHPAVRAVMIYCAAADSPHAG